MKTKTVLVILFSLSVSFSMAQLSPADKIPIKKKEELTIQPIRHATVVLNYGGKTVYIDPAGPAESFEGLPDPDMILITDINKNHLDLKTLENIHTANAIFIVPQAVADMLPELLIKKKLLVFNNGDARLFDGIGVAAIPMYSLPETDDAYYARGRGNGYVVGIGGKNVYVSGETDSIPEMKELKDIDIAFVSMNLPHTMNAKEAAATVLEFKPAIVYPYDCAAPDIIGFQAIVNETDKSIDVRVRNWFPSSNTAGLRAP